MKKLGWSTLIAFLLATITNVTYASGASAMEGYWFKGNSGAILGMGNKIIGVIQAIGIAAAVIMLIVIAVRFMMAAPGEKADLKKQLIPYVIGAILVFAASSILTIISYLGWGINSHV